jgi:hypothetical protein
MVVNDPILSELDRQIAAIEAQIEENHLQPAFSLTVWGKEPGAIGDVDEAVAAVLKDYEDDSSCGRTCVTTTAVAHAVADQLHAIFGAKRMVIIREIVDSTMSGARAPNVYGADGPGAPHWSTR